MPFRPHIATSPPKLRSESSVSVITFLLVIHTMIALALVGVILLQRSEGGGLGIGGGTGGGLMTARGAANLLTRSTTVLASLFIVSSIVLAVLAAGANKAKPIDTSLATNAAPVAPVSAPANLPGALPGLPATGAAPITTPATTTTPAAPAPAPAESGVPLAH